MHILDYNFSFLIVSNVLNAVIVTPSSPCKTRLCPVKNRLGIGVLGDSMVISDWRQSFLMPKAEPQGDKV